MNIEYFDDYIHPYKNVRVTSIAAFQEILDSNLIGNMHRIIIETLYKYGALSTSEIYHYGDFKKEAKANTGMAARLNELRKQDVVYERQHRICKITGRHVIEWALTGRMPLPKPKKLTKNQRIEMILKEIDNNIFAIKHTTKLKRDDLELAFNEIKTLVKDF